ncbi:alpha-hydroxy acid oxidase [Sphingomonas naphthae]|uniref:Alpha-hydroxy acid oxidase n=1 Tax=Sphingomonas naphthae TaxID=1813468 RepID=A0ABY7TP36_9SPHN|nr:alpha-hydroxy acid oxidase [Sphingomonas naphthae]WCT74471.1 alpha-hydroxy acid oxidase [Sphingomonas naphthae]
MTVAADDLFHLDEFEAQAKRLMSTAARDMANEGAGQGAGVRANRRAWHEWGLRSRVLRDVSRCDPSTTVMQTKLSFPAMIAPSGLHGLVHPDAELATARAAAAAGTVMVLSMNSSLPVEDVGKAGADLWFQLYCGQERAFVADVMARAAAAGCKAFCLTVDMPVRPWVLGPMRAALAAVGHIHPAHGHPRSGHLAPGDRWDHDARLTWRDIEWLRAQSALPLVIKGIMTPEDAVLAADHGADAIIVSNHGGRLLEEGFATAEVLPAIAGSLDGRIEILVDGGIRTGADIAKALALGARATLIGRPALWGLAVSGSAGVQRVLALLRGEFESIMGMIGAQTPNAIDRSTIAHRKSLCCQNECIGYWRLAGVCQTHMATPTDG